MEIDEFLLHERSRGDCYRLLSACYYLPKKELYLEENLFENLSTLLRKICPEAVNFSVKMGEAIMEYSDEDLAVEYAKLFVGPYELKAAPYGSVYLDEGRRVMGDSTMEVISMYRRKGLSINADFKELPDHITVELEFMNFLVYKEIEAWTKSKVEDAIEELRNQEIFLAKYLGAWVPDFSKTILENSTNPFYMNLAECTAVFIKNDIEYISNSKNISKTYS